ncbi:hypothetical protein WN944_023155 [Citrus x changshan-huyou]|uniref:Uncharacterized protein n=1 Tax=Citrus x changshan-huyou TaxID=2935761 RepID=A0AAP0R1T5_9ROSI
MLKGNRSLPNAVKGKFKILSRVHHSNSAQIPTITKLVCIKMNDHPFFSVNAGQNFSCENRIGERTCQDSGTWNPRWATFRFNYSAQTQQPSALHIMINFRNHVAEKWLLKGEKKLALWAVSISSYPC